MRCFVGMLISCNIRLNITCSMTLNDIIKQIFRNVPETRESSRLLIWEVYRFLEIVTGPSSGLLTKDSFLDYNTPHPSTIIRRARTIQKDPTYKPKKKPYRRRAVSNWDFSANVDTHTWERYR